MTEKSPNFVKKINMQGQEVQRVPNNMKPKMRTARHIIIKMPNVKDKENFLNDFKLFI